MSRDLYDQALQGIVEAIMSHTVGVVVDEAKLKSDLTTLRAWKPKLDKLKLERASASKKRWAARERVATIRDAYAKAASATLRSALSDVFVSLKFLRSAYSPDAEQQIIEAMGWRTIQVPRASVLIRQLTVPGLLNAIDNVMLPRS